MLPRRTLRITAWVLIFLIGTITLEGFDILTGANIIDNFIEPTRGCFG